MHDDAESENTDPLATLNKLYAKYYNLVLGDPLITEKSASLQAALLAYRQEYRRVVSAQIPCFFVPLKKGKGIFVGSLPPQEEEEHHHV